MRKLSRRVILIGASIWLATGGVVRAQEPEVGIKDLKEQIQQLAKIESDAGTPDDVKEINRGFLQKRRERLYSLLKKRQSALQRYQASVGTLLSANENRVIEDELLSIAQSLRELDGELHHATTTEVVNAPVESKSSEREKPAVVVSSASYSVPVLDRLTTGRTRRAAPTSLAAMQAVTCPITITLPDPAKYNNSGNAFPVLDQPSFYVTVKVSPPAGSNKLDDCDLEKFLIQTVNISKGASRTLSHEEPWKDRLAEQKLPVDLAEGENIITVKDAGNNYNSSLSLYMKCTGKNCGKSSAADIAAAGGGAAAGRAADTKEEEPFSPLTAFTRGIAGIDRSGASSADAEQKFLLEFNLRVPIAKKYRGEAYDLNNAVNSRFWAWFNPRITSLAQPTGISVSDINAAGSFFSPISGGKINDISQAFQLLGGFEVALLKPKNSRPIPSGLKDVRSHFAISLFAGGGFITPFSATQSPPQIFKVNQSIIERFPDAKDKDFIAFISQDRSRFFRQYYGGLRLTTNYFKVKSNGEEVPDDRFPGIFDLAFGQNESVTRGCLCGGVVRLEAFYPIPYVKSFYVFGTSLTKLSKPKVATSLILQPPDAVVPITSDKVFLQPVETSDRDFYRIGVGVDLIQLFKKDDKKADTTKPKED